MLTSDKQQHDTRPHFGLILVLVALIGVVVLPLYSRGQSARPNSATRTRSPRPAIPPVLRTQENEGSASAKHILIYGSSLDSSATFNEQTIAQASGYTVTVADDATWSGMTTAQFAAFDAIVFGDPSCDNIGGGELLTTAEATKSVWSPAITGPIYIQGTDPVYHQFPGGQTLITNGLAFAASGTGTGLYASLSCSFAFADDTPIDFLSGVGDFQARGTIGECSDTVTIVNPTHPAMAGLTNELLSNWQCSVHEFVTKFPSTLEVLVTADDLAGGFPPYIIASKPSAATPTPTPTATPTPTPTPLIYPKWTLTGNLSRARRFHTATLLSNGKVLVAGGIDPTTCGMGSCALLSSAELYDPDSGTWGNTGNLNRGRDFHTATLLANGKVLVTGGDYPGNSAELYDPNSGTWSVTGNLNVGRQFAHTATLLPNGKVLVAGGYNNGAYLSSAELYDPTTGTWSITGNLNTARSGSATLLPNGKVLVAGGETSSGNDQFSLNSAELYDPATGTWTFTGSLNTSRVVHTATLLPNGKVLVAGGHNPLNTIKSAEVYDSTTGTWNATGDLAHDLFFHTATLLPNGNVLVAGGSDNLSSAELFKPDAGNWTSTAYLNSGRWAHTATLLQNGKVLVAGGVDNRVNSAELYDPTASPNIHIIDDALFFVHQHYLDFLQREPDAAGLAYWTDQIASCGTDAHCIEVKRINVSAAFYVSIEFQETGYFVYRVNKAAHGNLPGLPVPIKRDEFLSQTTYEVGFGVIVGQPGWEQVLEANKRIFIEDPDGDRWTLAYPGSMTPAQFVDTLFANAEVTPSASERAEAISEFGAATDSFYIAARQRALRRVVDNPTLKQQEFNRAFVLMQYFGYLRRNPNDPPDHNFDGYNFWLNKLDQFHGNFLEAEMVKAFLSSVEYRQRFGPP